MAYCLIHGILVKNVDHDLNINPKLCSIGAFEMTYKTHAQPLLGVPPIFQCIETADILKICSISNAPVSALGLTS